MIDREGRPVGRLLFVQQTADPDALVEILTTATAAIAASDVVLYLIDYGHTALLPHPDILPHGEHPTVAAVDGSMAGRAFQSSTVLASERDDGWHVWVPVSERANKLGVLSMTMPRWDEEIEYFCTELGYAAAYLLMASAQYTDLPHLLRRRQDMDLAAEMQWSLLPPLSFASGTIALSAQLEPAYEVGGDAFDYAVNDGTLDLALFDAMGHGLGSAVMASLVVGAYRHGRRAKLDLAQLAISIDVAARALPNQISFATGLFARLEIETGRLSWLASGHPHPIIVRRGTALPDTVVAAGLPLGLGALGSVAGEIVEVSLEPGDGVLFYTDGVVDASSSTGEYFGEERLRDLLEREHLSGGSPQEVVRRLVRTTLEHSTVRLRDDATMVYVRWNADEPSG